MMGLGNPMMGCLVLFLLFGFQSGAIPVVVESRLTLLSRGSHYSAGLKKRHLHYIITLLTLIGKN